MKTFVLMLVIAIFALPTAWAVEDVPNVTQNLVMTDDELVFEIGLAINGITSGRTTPQAVCEGLAICRQTSTCAYRCFGAAGGDYNFEGCSGLVGLTICKFQGGPDACTVGCLPNPF
jgi:hypothetical protein